MMTGGSTKAETARFVELMDAFFDCLNVGNYTDGKHHRKPFQQPYHSSKDSRFNVRLILSYNYIQTDIQNFFPLVA